MRGVFKLVLLAAFLPGCATNVNLGDVIPADAEEEAQKLIECDTPECTRLLACYVVLGYGEVLYTDAKFHNTQTAVEKRGRFENAADRLRDWPKESPWLVIDARYASITILLAVVEAGEDKALEYIGAGLSIGTFKQLLGRAAIKAAVIDAVIDAIKIQEAKADPLLDRVNSCLERVDEIQRRLDVMGKA